MTGSAENAAERAQRELERVVRRWQQLPLGHALAASEVARHTVQRLADEVAAAETRRPEQPVPDLGPAVLMDQLAVVVYDHQEAGLSARHRAEALTTLRRSLP